MALTFVETVNSRKETQAVDSASVRLEWIAWRSNDENEVKGELLSLAGSNWDGLPLDSIEADPQGNGVWMCSATYSLRVPDDAENADDDEALGIAYSIDLTAGTAHITQSKETISITTANVRGTGLTVSANQAIDVYPDGLVPRDSDIGQSIEILGPSPPWNPGTYSIIDVFEGAWVLNTAPAAAGTTGGVWTSTVPGRNAPSYDQAIGVTRDRVEGCDIFTPKFEFSLTVKTFPMTLSFMRTLRSAVAKTNDAPWKGFETGEVLYLGVNGQAEPDDLWKLTHKFAVGENLVDVPVSPQITVDKGAWQYLWCTYQDAINADRRVQVPVAAYVERVYDATDFNLLRLNPPIADWSSSEPAGMHPLTVDFLDLSTGSPLIWLWDFGDGSGSSFKNPTHVYLVPGVYTVSLTVTNGAGSSFKTVHNYAFVS
jgi:hypothetical protein